MQINWKAVEGTQPERPKELDTASSPRCVYLRRNIKQLEKPTENGNVTVWSYEEARLSLSEYVQYQKELAECGSLSQQQVMENNLTLMGAIADSFEQQLAAGENQLIIMGAIADMFENIMLALADIQELSTPDA